MAVLIEDACYSKLQILLHGHDLSETRFIFFQPKVSVYVFHLDKLTNDWYLIYILKTHFPYTLMMDTQSRNLLRSTYKVRLEEKTVFFPYVLLSNHSDHLKSYVLRQFKLTNMDYYDQLMICCQYYSGLENCFSIYCTKCINYTSLMFKGHFIIWDPGITYFGLLSLRHRMISEDVCVYYVVKVST